MIEEIIQYPDERINIASADVRCFDEGLWELIDTLKQTAQAHDAPGLAAIQIAIPSAVVVAKDPDGNWQEFVNPRIIRHEGSAESQEKTLYMPSVTATIPRHEKITFIYQDKMGEQHTAQAEGPYGYLLQRKFDYIFGGTFANRLSREDRKAVEKRLLSEGTAGEFNSRARFSKREYFKSVLNKLLFFESLTLFAPLFDFKQETMLTLYRYDLFATIASLILIVGYWLYAKYEADRVISCTGCQVASFSAVALKYLGITLLLFAASYALVRPQ
jgi:peptide deformylase